MKKGSTSIFYLRKCYSRNYYDNINLHYEYTQTYIRRYDPWFETNNYKITQIIYFSLRPLKHT